MPDSSFWQCISIGRVEDFKDAVYGAGLEATQMSRPPLTGSIIFAERDNVLYSSGRIGGRVSLFGPLSQDRLTLGIGLDLAPGTRHWLTEVETGAIGVFRAGDEHDALYEPGSLYAAATLTRERLEELAAEAGFVLDGRTLGGTRIERRRYALAELTRVYPLWATEKDVKPMKFPNASSVRVNLMYPVDGEYWTKLKAFVDHEPTSAIAAELRGVLASIGIIKGQPFEPEEREKKMLQKAVETAPRMILALRQLGRKDKRNKYYEDRQWEQAWSGGTADWMQESYLDFNARTAFFQYAYSSAPAMVMHTTGAGSKYPYAVRDADGDFLDGSKTYKLHLPPNPPAALFWAVTAYNITDGTMPETDQTFPSTNSYYNIPKNSDGSVDIWFGPKKPADVADAAYIQTIPGRAFVVPLRLYGAEHAFYDQTWKPDDFVKVD